MSSTEAALNFHLSQMDKDEEARAEYEAAMEKYHSELSCYGTTEEELEKAKPEFMSDAFEAMSWLSDAQEMLSKLGRDEQYDAWATRKANQFINRSKYFLGKVTKAEREAMEVESNDTLMVELIIEREDAEADKNW